ncbi:MAG: VOC family protein [Micromonosporaceae bacterium]
MSKIVWWEIEAPDPEGFQQFHAEMWGWTFRRAFEDSGLDAEYWIIASAGEAIGGLQRAATSTRPHPGVRLYLQVDDLEEVLGKVESLGGRVERRRTELGGRDGWYGTVIDPAGVTVGLWTAAPRT